MGEAVLYFEDLSYYGAPEFTEQIVLADAVLGPAFTVSQPDFKLAVMAVVIRACHEEGLEEPQAHRFVELVYRAIIENPENNDGHARTAD
jgi:hypothetical protein